MDLTLFTQIQKVFKMLKTTRYYLYLLSIIIITLVNCLVGLSPSGTFTKLRTSLFLSIMALSEFKKDVGVQVHVIWAFHFEL